MSQLLWTADKEEKEEDRGPGPLQPKPPLWSCAPQPATQAWAQQPGPTARMALHAGQGLARSGWAEQRPGLSSTCSRSSPTRGAGAPHLQTQRPRLWQPNPEHVAARSGFVDKAKYGMASLYLSTPKGQTVASTLCTKALLHSPYSFFNLLVSRELL